MKLLRFILIVLIACFLWASTSWASLDFAGATHKVDHGSATSLDDLLANTVMAWVWVDTAVNDGRIFQKGYLAAHSTYNTFGFDSMVRFKREMDRATTDCAAFATLTNFSAWGLGKWLFIAAGLDQAGVDADQYVIMGDLSTSAAEPSSYTTRAVGSGAYNTDAAASFITGQRGNDGLNWDGKIAFLAFYNRRMPIAEAKIHQFHPYKASGAVLFEEYGFNGTSTQPDWSGTQNTGTVTGATVAVHVPLGPIFGFDDAMPSTAAVSATCPQTLTLLGVGC